MCAANFIPVVAAAAFLMIGCQSASPPPKAPATLPPREPGHSSFTASAVRWHVPSGLPVFGTPTANSIRVAIFGMPQTVSRPGYYHLPQGTVVRDAVEAAGGLSPFTWWRIYSGLQRPKPDGSWEIIVFTRNRTAEEQILLQDGDHLYFGHEAY